jgi:DNA-cytosine methyltransferase
MNVLSLFDGMACGLQALKQAGVKVDNYFASEIDKHAIFIAKKNHPEIIHIGDVTKVETNNGKLLVDNKEYTIDLIIGGSPCQGFSFAGKQLNFDDPRSKLFFKYLELKNELKPKFFLLENVKMKKEYENKITELLGVEPVVINSALLSAQNRVRLYWANFPITQPEDKKILLKDIIITDLVDRDKSFCIDANYFKGTNPKQYFEKHRRQAVFEETPLNYSSSGRGNGVVESRVSFAEKAATLTATGYNLRSTTISIDSNLNIRKLTPVECERLQTLPDNYTEGVSNSQRYKMLGNGWTVSVVEHIFRGLK